MKKVIYFFTAFLVMIFLTSCKVLPQTEEEYYQNKDQEQQIYEMDLNEEFNNQNL